MPRGDNTKPDFTPTKGHIRREAREIRRQWGGTAGRAVGDPLKAIRLQVLSQAASDLAYYDPKDKAFARRSKEAFSMAMNAHLWFKSNDQSCPFGFQSICLDYDINPTRLAMAIYRKCRRYSLDELRLAELAAVVRKHVAGYALDVLAQMCQWCEDDRKVVAHLKQEHDRYSLDVLGMVCRWCVVQ
jgi:hypothetical protein